MLNAAKEYEDLTFDLSIDIYKAISTTIAITIILVIHRFQTVHFDSVVISSSLCYPTS